MRVDEFWVNSASITGQQPTPGNLEAFKLQRPLHALDAPYNPKPKPHKLDAQERLGQKSNQYLPVAQWYYGG